MRLRAALTSVHPAHVVVQVMIAGQCPRPFWHAYSSARPQLPSLTGGTGTRARPTALSRSHRAAPRSFPTSTRHRSSTPVPDSNHSIWTSMYAVLYVHYGVHSGSPHNSDDVRVMCSRICPVLYRRPSSSNIRHKPGLDFSLSPSEVHPDRRASTGRAVLPDQPRDLSP